MELWIERKLGTNGTLRQNGNSGAGTNGTLRQNRNSEVGTNGTLSCMFCMGCCNECLVRTWGKPICPQLAVPGLRTTPGIADEVVDHRAWCPHRHSVHSVCIYVCMYVCMPAAQRKCYRLLPPEIGGSAVTRVGAVFIQAESRHDSENVAVRCVVRHG